MRFRILPVGNQPKGIEDKLRAKGLRIIRRAEVNEFRFGNAGTLQAREVAQIPLTLGRS